MSLTVLDNQFRIEIANDDFFNTLFNSSIKSIKGKVLFQIYKDKKLEYFYTVTDMYILKTIGFWFSRIENDNRFIYVFGVNEPKDTDSNIPICTIDFSISGINKKTAGVYGQDKHGNVSVLYRVNQDLNLKSFELEFKGKWIQAQESYKNNYFILMGNLNQNFLDSFKNFLVEFEQNVIDSKHEPIIGDNPSNSLISFKSCLRCDKVINSSKSNYYSIISELDIENPGYCTDCLEKLAAANVLKKIGDVINLKVFNRKSLLERVDDPDVFKSYLDFLIGLGFLREVNKDLIILSKNKDLDEFINQYNEKGESSFELEHDSGKKCVKCGVVLSSENSYKYDSLTKGFSEMCKDCSRKIYAVKALNNLEKYVDPGLSFNKDDLLEQVDNRTRFLDYIWTLQEFDLLETYGANNDLYILKPEEDLIQFKKEFGDEIEEPETFNNSKDISTQEEEKPLKKVVKECEICGQVLPISKFYKSSISDDGFTEKCKDCSRKSYAAKALSELKRYVVPDTEFLKEDLLNQSDNKNKLLDYFWTLQEFDFIEHNEKNNTYIMKPKNEIDSFIEQFGEEIKEPTHIVHETGKERKTVKKCKTCEQILPISDYYKSSESDDGFLENCKKCSDKINAAKILSEIKKYIGIGIPFSKKELSNQLGNPTKVDYYIWILQEHDLIDNDEKKGTYVVEESSNYKNYESFLEQSDSEKRIQNSIQNFY